MVVRQEWKGQENGGAGAKEGAKSKSVTGTGERESVGASKRRRGKVEGKWNCYCGSLTPRPGKIQDGDKVKQISEHLRIEGGSRWHLQSECLMGCDVS